MYVKSERAVLCSSISYNKYITFNNNNNFTRRTKLINLYEDQPE